MHRQKARVMEESRRSAHDVPSTVVEHQRHADDDDAAAAEFLNR